MFFPLIACFFLRNCVLAAIRRKKFAYACYVVVVVVFSVFFSRFMCLEQVLIRALFYLTNKKAESKIETVNAILIPKLVSCISQPKTRFWEQLNFPPPPPWTPTGKLYKINGLLARLYNCRLNNISRHYSLSAKSPHTLF